MGKRNNPEARKQAELISRLNEWGNFELFKDYMKWVHHIPNGGMRSKSSAIEMKAIGLKPGVHDLCCPWPTDEHGMATIEMKSDIGSTSNKQDDYTDFMEMVGNVSITTNCVNTAERFIIRYMIAAKNAPQFRKFEVIDTDEYYFDGSDPYIQQKHAVKIIERGTE